MPRNVITSTGRPRISARSSRSPMYAPNRSGASSGKSTSTSMSLRVASKSSREADPTNSRNETPRRAQAARMRSRFSETRPTTRTQFYRLVPPIGASLRDVRHVPFRSLRRTARAVHHAAGSWSRASRLAAACTSLGRVEVFRSTFPRQVNLSARRSCGDSPFAPGHDEHEYREHHSKGEHWQ